MDTCSEMKLFLRVLWEIINSDGKKRNRPEHISRGKNEYAKSREYELRD